MKRKMLCVIKPKKDKLVEKVWLIPDLWQSWICHGNDVFFPLWQNYNIVNGPLVIAFPRVKRLPPTKPCGWRLRGQRKLIVYKSEQKNKKVTYMSLPNYTITAVTLKTFQLTKIVKADLLLSCRCNIYFLLSSSAGFSPRLGEVSEVHLSYESPADASIVAVLQQHSLLPAVCLVTICPVSAHSQVELHKLRPFCV